MFSECSAALTGASRESTKSRVTALSLGPCDPRPQVRPAGLGQGLALIPLPGVDGLVITGKKNSGISRPSHEFGLV